MLELQIHMDTPSGIKDSIPAWIKFSIQAPGEIPYNGIYYDPPIEVYFDIFLRIWYHHINSYINLIYFHLFLFILFASKISLFRRNMFLNIHNQKLPNHYVFTRHMLEWAAR